MPNRERQPNDRLRRARGELSQERLAELVNAEIHRVTGRVGAVTAKTISDYERGWYSWPSAPVRTALCTVLGAVEPGELGFRRQWPTRSSSAAASTAATVVPAFASDRSSTNGLAEVLDGIQEAIDTRRRSGRIDPARITDLATIAALHRRGYRDIAASRLIPAAHAHLHLTWSLRPDYQPDEARRRLLTVIGEMAALVGTLLLLDQQRPLDAHRYVELAWSAAAGADNPELQAVVLGVRSFHAAHGAGDHRAGLEHAERARVIAAAGGSVETRGWVSAVASERAASLGDLAGCQRLLEESRVALAAPADETPVLGIGEFTADKLVAYEGGDLVRVGRYRDAEPALTAAIDNLGPYLHRHRGTALIDRAEARLAAGDVDAACDDGRAALQLVAQVEHAGNFDRIHTLATRAHATGSSTGRALLDQVLDLTADPKGRP